MIYIIALNAFLVLLLLQVTYMYYTGRLEVFNDQFKQADEKLMYALVHCDPLKRNNIR